MSSVPGRLAGVLLVVLALTGSLLAPARALVVPRGTTSFRFGLYDQPISHLQWNLDGMPSPQIVVNYQAWEQNPAPLVTFARAARQHGALVYAELASDGCRCGPVTLQAIVQGRYDAYLRAFARAVASFGHPMLLTWDHEMNGTWYPWGVQNYPPLVWVAGWRHVYDVIHPIARNAIWVWAPNTQVGAAPVGPYWPGAKYVNRWGVDCYLGAPGQTFASVCSATVTDIRHHTTLPGLLTETGIESPLDRPARIPGLVRAARAAGLTGLVWFDKGGSYLHRAGRRALAQALGPR